MRIFNRTRLGLSVAIAFASASAFAQTTTSGTTSVPSYNFSTTPPAYAAQGIANLATTISSCTMGSIGDALGAIGTATTGSALPTSVGDIANQLQNNGASGGSCNGSDQAPQSDQNGDNVCQAAISNGKFDSSYFDQLTSQADQIQSTIACKLKDYQNLQSEMQCMASQSQSLQSQIASLSTSLQTNLTAQMKDWTTINNVILDRQAQEAQVANRLGSAGASGSAGSGLLGAQNQLTNDLANWSTAISTQQTQVTQFNIQTAQLVVTAQQRTMALTTQCFQDTPEPNYQCVPNGPPVSAEQYVLCRVNQQQQVTNGYVINSSSAQAAGNAQQEGLQAVLTNIFNETSTFQTVATNLTASSPNATVDQIVAQEEQSQPITSLSDIETQFGASLEAFNQNNFNVEGTIMSALSSCYGQAQATVNQEETTPGSSLYNQQQAITQGEATLHATVDQQLYQMANDYTQGMAALTLTHVAMPISACTAATVQNEMTCVTDMQTNLNALLYGNSSTTNVSISLPTDGAAGSSAINFTCEGISGCVTAYEAVQTNLTNEVVQLGQEQKTYVTNANAATDAFMNNIKSALSGQSQALTLKMNQLNSQLAGLGLTPVSTSTYPSTPMPTDPTSGLYTMPPSLLATIGGGLTPPMIDMSGDPITAAEQAVATGLAAEQTDQANIQTYLNNISSEEANCKSQDANNYLGYIVQQAGSMITDCVPVPNYCPGGSSSSSLQGLLQQVDSLSTLNSSGSSPFSGNSTSVDADLEAGYVQQCNQGGGAGLQKALDLLRIYIPSTPDALHVSGWTVPDASACPTGNDQSDCTHAESAVNDAMQALANGSDSTQVGQCQTLVQNVNKEVTDYQNNWSGVSPATGSGQ